MNLSIKEIMKSIPLKTRILVTVEMSLIDLLSEMGFRESKSWDDDESELRSKLRKHANEIAQRVLKDINEWEKDGEPQ